jgi:hypothetical protein
MGELEEPLSIEFECQNMRGKSNGKSKSKRLMRIRYEKQTHVIHYLES